MTEPLVRRVDHVVVPVADPAPLFSLFSGTLGLPVAWPIVDKGAYTSGAVCLGNCNLEFIAPAPGSSPFLVPTEPLTVRAIAFEPADGEQMARSLRDRGIAHQPPAPYPGADGAPMFTNVFLMEPLVGEAAMVFTCDYHGSTRRDRVAVREAFPSSGGGALGVRRLSEITLGLRDERAAADRWRRFLAPREPDAHGAFAFDDGPAVRIKHSPIDGVAGMWLEVESLAAARDTLRERDLLGPVRASGIGIDYARTGGLDVWLSEPR